VPDILQILNQSIVITLFVLAMMLVIEYLNILSKGLWSKNLENSPVKQVVFGALLGLIPGCLGAYTAVSLYIHNIFSTGALVATMIATSGDEAFMMFSVIPDTAIIIHIIIFIVAIVAGLTVNAVSKKKLFKYKENHFHIHKEESDCVCFDAKTIIHQIKHISFVRLAIFIGLAATLTGVILNLFHEEHHHHESAQLILNQHEHPIWISITFIVVLSISTLIVLTVNDHFLKEHVWKHIIKKHFARIFLWTFFTLLALSIVINYVDLESLIGDNLYLVLLIAVLVGIIPESGPHFVFVILFASGSLPLSILLASSIVQDGHGSLPLLAESRKSFVIVKAINIAVGLIVGIIGLMTGF
jgi:hypothetical protein